MDREQLLENISQLKKQYVNSSYQEKIYLVNDLYWLNYFYKIYYGKRKDFLLDLEDYKIYQYQTNETLKNDFIKNYEDNKKYYQELFFRTISLYDLEFPFDQNLEISSENKFTNKEVDEIFSEFCSSYSDYFYRLYNKQKENNTTILDKKIKKNFIYYFGCLNEAIIHLDYSDFNLSCMLSYAHELGHLLESSLQNKLNLYNSTNSNLYEISSSFMEILFLKFLESQQILSTQVEKLQKLYYIKTISNI